jgi:elongation factor P hydroxylase
VPMVDGDYGFIPPGRDDRVQSLLKSVEIQMNLRR